MMISGHSSVVLRPDTDDCVAHIACPECDLLFQLPPPAAGVRMECARCESLLTAPVRDGLRRSLAFALAAVVLLVVANLFPFLSFRASGLEQVMTLPQSAGVLYEQGNIVLAAFVLIFILIAPALLAACLTVLLFSLVNGKRMRGLAVLGRAISMIRTWSMVEVFLIGVLVSYIKIAALATVVFGISFWGFAGFVVCLTAALAAVDRHQLWSAIEEAQS